MKCIFLTIFILTIFGNSYGQTKTVKLLHETIGTIELSYEKQININNEDTSYRVFLFFQNFKYRSITDTRVIGFLKSASMDEFVADLSSAYKQMGEKVNMDYSKPRYNISLYDFTKDLSLGDGKTGYTYLSKKQVSKLLDVFGKIKFGSD